MRCRAGNCSTDWSTLAPASSPSTTVAIPSNFLISISLRLASQPGSFKHRANPRVLIRAVAPDSSAVSAGWGGREDEEHEQTASPCVAYAVWHSLGRHQQIAGSHG